VTGIVGSHRPRFGVFGVPVLVAEHLEAAAETGTVLCSVAAQRAYLASSFTFVPRRLGQVPVTYNLYLRPRFIKPNAGRCTTAPCSRRS
jgi:class 3 adenylate cyclase